MAFGYSSRRFFAKFKGKSRKAWASPKKKIVNNPFIIKIFLSLLYALKLYTDFHVLQSWHQSFPVLPFSYSLCITPEGKLYFSGLTAFDGLSSTW
jgi:hypothetical protein